MEIPSLDTALVRLTKVFPYYIEFMLALMALGGLFLVASGLQVKLVSIFFRNINYQWHMQASLE